MVDFPKYAIWQQQNPNKGALEYFEEYLAKVISTLNWKKHFFVTRNYFSKEEIDDLEDESEWLSERINKIKWARLCLREVFSPKQNQQ